MKSDLKERMKQRKGITLIALVITIIVLLILTGVAIATLTGENGILNQANQAKIRSDIAEVKEQAQLDIANWMAEKLKNGEDTTLNDETVYDIINGANENNTNKYYSKLTETSIITKQGNEILFSEFYKKEEVKGVDYSQLCIGDYVSNYPVQYDNVGTWVNESSGEILGGIPQSKYNGWRILSIEGEGDDAYVKLVSAGVPLNYFYDKGDVNVGRNLGDYFFITSIESSITKNKFYKCGFKTASGAAVADMDTVKELFNNEFTPTYRTHIYTFPNVKPMTKDDLDKVVGYKTSPGDDFVTNDLLAIPCEVKESFEYGNEIDGEYVEFWLYGDAFNRNYKIVNSWGSLHASGYGALGVRPVVTLKSNVKFTPAESNINDTQTWDIAM